MQERRVVAENLKAILYDGRDVEAPKQIDEERIRKNMERDMYHIVKNLTDLLSHAITTLKKPPIGIIPLEIKVFSKFHDPHQIIHTVRGDQDTPIRSLQKRQEIYKYFDYILGAGGWAFERNGESLDGKKARVVIG